MDTTPLVPGEKRPLQKCPTGIAGLDEVLYGGLPLGRTTLVCGGTGCGKTMLGMEFLVHGITEFGEPGVFLAFGESSQALRDNVTSIGFDLQRYETDRMLILDHVGLDGGMLHETGDWDLEGLFLRLDLAITSIGAKRVVLDTLEMLFGSFSNDSILRAELRRLFTWLEGRGVTTVLTGERGDGALTRHGFEEYVSDCVLVLDQRLVDQVATRRLRVLKYRGSAHESNEFPFVVGESGMVVIPITTRGTRPDVSTEVMSIGTPDLDRLLGKGGVFRGSSTLVSGVSGSGKSSLAAACCVAACTRGERAAYFAFEESADELIRNMASIGLDLQRHIAAGLLVCDAHRPYVLGLESHLVAMQEIVLGFHPDVVVIDPLSSMLRAGTDVSASAMLTRMIDFLKVKGVTAVFTTLLHNEEPDVIRRATDAVTSEVDVLVHLDRADSVGEVVRILSIAKARGMAHSRDIREYEITGRGIRVIDECEGPSGEVLFGRARRRWSALPESSIVGAP